MQTGSQCNTTTAGNPVTGNCVSHFYPDTRMAVDPTTLAGVVAYLEARLVLINGAGTDDRANAKLLIEAGGDAYISTTSNNDPSVRPSLASGKYKYVQLGWRSYAMTTMTLAQLQANPPPINITGILP
jgi:hypothetical protein